MGERGKARRVLENRLREFWSLVSVALVASLEEGPAGRDRCEFGGGSPSMEPTEGGGGMENPDV